MRERSGAGGGGEETEEEEDDGEEGSHVAAVFGGQWKNPATGTEIQTGCENQSCCSIDAEFVQFLLQI